MGADSSADRRGRIDAEFAAFLVGVGRRIAALRRRCGTTQQEAAAEAHMELVQWQRVERGRTNATLQTIFKVAKSLGVPPAKVIEPLRERNPEPAKRGRPRKASSPRRRANRVEPR